MPGSSNSPGLKGKVGERPMPWREKPPPRGEEPQPPVRFRPLPNNPQIISANKQGSGGMSRRALTECEQV